MRQNPLFFYYNYETLVQYGVIKGVFAVFRFDKHFS